MAKSPSSRKRERKNISSGIAHVNASFNNTMITIVGLPIGNGKPQILRIKYAKAMKKEKPATKNPTNVLSVNGKAENPMIPFRPMRKEPRNRL